MWNKSLLCALAVVLVSAGPITPPATQPTTQSAQERVTPSGLRITDIKTGDPCARKGDVVWVHYTCFLADGTSNGTKIDSSYDHVDRAPLEVKLGMNPPEVLPGWEEGLLGMKVGDKRHLVLPPSLAYGAAGRPPLVGPNATLVFDVELIGLARVSE